MTTAHFEEDPNFRAELLRSVGVKTVLEELAGRAAARAAELAPDDPRTQDNDLHSSVYGDVAMTPRGWAGRVGATNFKAPWFEVGSARTPARPFLRPAVEETVGPIEADPEGEE